METNRGRRPRRHSRREVLALDAALKWARDNGFGGDCLPRGRRDSADSCPLARATGWLIASPFGAPPVEGRLQWFTLPALVDTFVDLFDKGRYPELVQL